MDDGLCAGSQWQPIDLLKMQQEGVTEYSVYYSSELQLLLVQCGYRFTYLIGKCSLSSFPFAAQLEVQW